MNSKLMKGLTFWMNQKDYFYETEQKNVTEQLVCKIMKSANLPKEKITDVCYRIRKANCKIVTLPNGRQYYEIYGHNFGGRGSFVGDGKTVIINCIKH